MPNVPRLRYDEGNGIYPREGDAVTASENTDTCVKGCPVFRYLGWTSVAVGVAAVGVFVGRELRKRYNFNHRTPSDFYSHAGDELQTEYGVGI